MDASNTLRYPRVLPSKVCASRIMPSGRGQESIGEEASVPDLDHEKLRRAALLILEAIGEDVEREGLRETPDRFARMFKELCCGVGVDAADEITCTFNEGSDGLVVVKDIRFNSMCEHHLVPFVGHAHIAYLPKDGVVTGLSKLARVVEATSKRPQVQERMTVEIADAIEKAIDPKGIAIILEAEHFCMSMRGIKKPGSKTLTTAFRGVLEQDRESRAEALSILRD